MAEILAISILSRTDIQRIKIGREEFLLSKMTYVFSVFSTPQDFIKQLNTIIYKIFEIVPALSLVDRCV